MNSKKVLEDIKEVVHTDIPADSYFATQVAEMTEEFSKYGLTVKDICFVAKKLMHFEKVVDLLDGYVATQKILSKNVDDMSMVPVQEHVKLYKKLSVNNTTSWSQIVHTIASQGYTRGKTLTNSFNIAFKLDNHLKVGDFFDFSSPLQNKNVDEQIMLYKKSPGNTPEESAFDVVQKDYNLPLEKLAQENYRSNWLDSSHAYEHEFSRMDRN
ncbi:MAG: hypothetical protein KJ583_01770 [Nanoarchaeota archaeon]|nr:hypothetical protein [Nanoarchaeota archaeon]MBU1269719.1 hypothetical protein [Nanoarchaeota archaeon]MBU1604020.1 hypothetical protein [Nanoarchaeota archaeon]